MTWEKFSTPWAYPNPQHKTCPVGRLLREIGGTVVLIGDVNELFGSSDEFADRTVWTEYCDDLIPLIKQAGRQ